MFELPFKERRLAGPIQLADCSKNMLAYVHCLAKETMFEDTVLSQCDGILLKSKLNE